MSLQELSMQNKCKGCASVSSVMKLILWIGKYLIKIIQMVKIILRQMWFFFLRDYEHCAIQFYALALMHKICFLQLKKIAIILRLCSRDEIIAGFRDYKSNCTVLLYSFISTTGT